MSDFIRIGHVLPVLVSVSGAKKVSFSLLGSRVNDGLARELLVPGMAIAGCVQSIEDRGYSINTGIPDCRAFVASSRTVIDDDDDENNNENDANERKLRVGEPIVAIVSSVPASRGPVQLSFGSDLLMEASDKVMFRLLRAGSLVDASVVAHVSNGITVRLFGFLLGTIAAEHLPSPQPEVDSTVSMRSVGSLSSAYNAMCAHRFAREYCLSIQRANALR